MVKVGSSETLCRSGISTGEGRGTRRRWGHPGQAAYRWAREMGVQGLQEENGQEGIGAPEGTEPGSTCFVAPN